MSSLKTLALTGLIGLSCGQVALANTDIARTFAQCTGRLSAAVEHAWLMRDAAAGELHAQRSAFEALLDAAHQSDPKRMMAYRIESKAAQANLLRTATFDQNQARANHARRLTMLHMNACTALLLDS